MRRALIEAYFKSLLDLLAPLPTVENPHVAFEKRAEMVGFIRGEITFTDSSMLHFRELVDLRQPMRLIMYAYHYQNAEGALVFRYDNTAHHMNVDTFPHHKHSADGNIVAVHDVPGLEAILCEIEAFRPPSEDTELSLFTNRDTKKAIKFWSVCKRSWAINSTPTIWTPSPMVKPFAGATPRSGCQTTTRN